MPNIKKIPFSQAKSLLQEGDVLLFRGKSWISKVIQTVGTGEYSHCGVCSNWSSGIYSEWEVAEFKEGCGCRTVNLERYVGQNDGIIDVYRAESNFVEMHYDGEKINEIIHNFDGRCISNTMRCMTSLPYSYAKIWFLAQEKLPFLRFFYNIESRCNDELQAPVYPVCSSSLAYCYSKCGFKLVKNRSDEYVEPSDISRSPLLSYLFTLTI